ncbi:PREDICTED: uncharacterized protein LOC105448639 [Wasmannia auropunctata]|uniref:uncharacterized protein LOC105448639 n=1 Tax=Wasmannia auropunctata TaxID=64793 RepID=UPI0005F037B0|nr:PREDICTED: uncharacterized protein LOC105448639 [Wasmannia auropunctata]
MINELPINIRSKNMILIGLWIDACKPDMNIFLQPFINQANNLSSNGISWKLSDNVTITSLVMLLLCSVDSMARSAILNMKQCNGKSGCTFYEHPTEGVSVQTKSASRILWKYTVSTDIPLNRTDASIRRDMIIVCNAKNGKDVNGIWEPSCLMNLHYFDLGDGFDSEYMHSCLLGVQRQYMEILLTSFGKDYYVGSPQKMNIINMRLMSIQTPKCITRTPRSLKDIRLWKASEWRSWAILYLLVCLRGILSEKYVNHLTLFVSALNILLQKSINSKIRENITTQEMNDVLPGLRSITQAYDLPTRTLSPQRTNSSLNASRSENSQEINELSVPSEHNVTNSDINDPIDYDRNEPLIPIEAVSQDPGPSSSKNDQNPSIIKSTKRKSQNITVSGSQDSQENDINISNVQD